MKVAFPVHLNLAVKVMSIIVHPGGDILSLHCLIWQLHPLITIDDGHANRISMMASSGEP